MTISNKNQQQKYFISATVRNKNKDKILISATDLKNAFEVEKELFSKYTENEVYKICRSKSKPRLKDRTKQYIEISDINQISVIVAK